MAKIKYTFQDALDFSESTRGVMEFTGCLELFVKNKHQPIIENQVSNLCFKFYKKKYKLTKNMSFKHGASYLLPNNTILIPCYHPSPRNVNTKISSEKMMVALFKKAKKLTTI